MNNDINNYSVVQSNQLIEASYKLSLEEKRLLMACISQVDSRSDVPEKITISASHYADIYKLNTNAAYKQLQNAADGLYERDIRFKSGNTLNRVRWVYKVEYQARSGNISLKFSPEIKPYLGQLSNRYSPYKLENVSTLKSIYSIRLYELLSQYIDYGQRWITIDDLREMFVLQDKYVKYSELRKYVIEAAVKELNKKTNYEVSYSQEKEGRKVVKLWFFFKEKQQAEFAFN